MPSGLDRLTQSSFAGALISTQTSPSLGADITRGNTVDYDNETDDEYCRYWDDDGCYCVCGAACACEASLTVVNVGDELHTILAEALAAAHLK